MSPDILTLVAAVLVYDRAYDPSVDWGDGRFGMPPFPSLSRNARSDTRVENDMMEMEHCEVEKYRWMGVGMASGMCQQEDLKVRGYLLWKMFRDDDCRS